MYFHARWRILLAELWQLVFSLLLNILHAGVMCWMISSPHLLQDVDCWNEYIYQATRSVKILSTAVMMLYSLVHIFDLWPTLWVKEPNIFSACDVDGMRASLHYILGRHQQALSFSWQLGWWSTLQVEFLSCSFGQSGYWRLHTELKSNSWKIYSPVERTTQSFFTITRYWLIIIMFRNSKVGYKCVMESHNPNPWFGNRRSLVDSSKLNDA